MTEKKRHNHKDEEINAVEAEELETSENSETVNLQDRKWMYSSL